MPSVTALRGVEGRLEKDNNLIFLPSGLFKLLFELELLPAAVTPAHFLRKAWGPTDPRQAERPFASESGNCHSVITRHQPVRQTRGRRDSVSGGTSPTAAGGPRRRRLSRLPARGDTPHPLPAADLLGAKFRPRGILPRSRHGSENQSSERPVTSVTRTARPGSRGFRKEHCIGMQPGPGPSPGSATYRPRNLGKRLDRSGGNATCLPRFS